MADYENKVLTGGGLNDVRIRPLLRQGLGAAYDSEKCYIKVAEADFTTMLDSLLIVAHPSWRNRACGLIHVGISIEKPSSPIFTWVVANGYDLSNFYLAYDDDTTHVEIWKYIQYAYSYIYLRELYCYANRAIADAWKFYSGDNLTAYSSLPEDLNVVQVNYQDNDKRT